METSALPDHLLEFWQIDELNEQRSKISAATRAILHTTRQLMAARDLGQTEQVGYLFTELEVLFSVERREATTLSGLLAQFAKPIPVVLPSPEYGEAPQGSESAPAPASAAV